MTLDSRQTEEQGQRETGRTLIELTRREDGSWRATQQGVNIEGSGETGALATMEYCRKIASHGEKSCAEPQ